MTQEWQIDGPKVLDVGNENETVGKLRLGLVAGRVFLPERLLTGRLNGLRKSESHLFLRYAFKGG